MNSSEKKFEGLKIRLVMTKSARKKPEKTCNLIQISKFLGTVLQIRIRHFYRTESKKGFVLPYPAPTKFFRIDQNKKVPVPISKFL